MKFVVLLLGAWTIPLFVNFIVVEEGHLKKLLFGYGDVTLTDPQNRELAIKRIFKSMRCLHWFPIFENWQTFQLGQGPILNGYDIFEDNGELELSLQKMSDKWFCLKNLKVCVRARRFNKVTSSKILKPEKNLLWDFSTFESFVLCTIKYRLLMLVCGLFK